MISETPIPKPPVEPESGPAYEKKFNYVVVITVLAAAIGLLFNYLFYGKYVGISFPIFTLVLLAALLALGRGFGLFAAKRAWLMAPLFAFSLVPFFRASILLAVINIFACIGLFLLLVEDLIGNKVPKFNIWQYVQTVLVLPFMLIAEGARAFSFLNRASGKKRRLETSSRVFKGLLIALPVLFVFVLLFAGADLAFRQSLERLFSFKISGDFVAEIFIFLIIGYLALGVFMMLFNQSHRPSAHIISNPDNAKKPSPRVELAVFLGSIAVLFFIFIIFQIAYLFGGSTNITGAGFTYAEYAQRGFWELIVAAILTLGVLLLAEKFSKNEGGRDLSFFVPALVIIAEVFVIVFSAYTRLGLYLDAYGFTILRFYVPVFIMFIFVVFVILGLRILLSKKVSFFTFGVLLALIAFVAGMDLVNPDAYIVRKNYEHYQKTGKLDPEYFREMSADAVPQLLTVWTEITDNDLQGRLTSQLLSKRDEFSQTGHTWQSYNIALSRGLKLLNAAIRE